MEAYTVNRDIESTLVPSTIDININDLTSDVVITDDNTIIGDGAFDKLMSTVELHIKKQYDDGRITAEDYANVYLNSLVKVLEVSNAFVLESKVKNYQIQEIVENTKLVASKKILTDNQTALIDEQIKESKAKTTLTQTETDSIMNYRNNNTHAQTLLTYSKIKSEEFNNQLVATETEKVSYEVDYILPANKLKLEADIALVNAQEHFTETKDAAIAHDNNLKDAQTAVANKQVELIERQTKGFDDDAKLRLIKEQLGNWSVAYSVAQDDASIPDSVKVNPIDSVTRNLFDSLGITNTNDPLGE